MATITTRSGKGSPLTNSEVDANFTNLNSDKIELTNLSITTASASGGGSLAYANSTGVFTFTPPDLTSFLTSLSSNDTDDLSEGSTNLYFTNARARGAVSVTDSGGDGSLAYNSSTGVITYTGPSASEVRAHISGGTGVTVTSGEIAIGQAVATTSNVTFNNIIASGNLTVNGTTTTVNSTTVTVDDPIFTLGGDTAPASDDNKDRGIEFRWHNGSAAKVGFFGYDDSAGAFTFIQDATNSSEVFSGTAGDVVFGGATVSSLTLGSTAITATGAEINYIDGVTSNVQTQLDAKQASDAQLTDIAGLTPSDGGFIVGDGSNFVLESGATARASLGLTIGTHVLAYDSNLQSFATAFTLPTSDGTSGQALTTNGSGTLAFSDVDALPSQSGNSGYYLTTDGSSASWDNLTDDPTFTGTVTVNSTEALTLPAGTTAQRPTAATGMLRYNSTLGKVEFYNGSAWSNINIDNVYTRTNITATSGQTSFSVSYDVGYVDVFLNGVKLLSGTEFTATSGSAIVLASGATTGDIFEAIAWNKADVSQNAYTRTSYTATNAQTTFAATYTVGLVNVYMNGVLLLDGTEYTATNGTSIVLAAGAATGDSIVIEAFSTFSVSSALAKTSNLSDLASASTARTNLGVAIGSDVQAYDAQLADVAGLTPSDGNFIVGDGSNFVTESGATAIASLGITSTAAELNLVDGSSAGTITNSKAVIYGSSGEVNATTLQIAGTSITATAAEINKLDGVTATTAELNYVDGVTSNIQTQIDNISPSPTITATASGTLANGDTVCINSDGTVSAVTGSSATEGSGSLSVFNSANTLYTDCVYDKSNDKLVIGYRDAGNSNYITAIVGTVSGSSISFGTEATVSGESTGHFSITYDENAAKVLFVYEQAAGLTGRVGTVSGTSISFGTETTLYSGAIRSSDITSGYDVNAQKHAVFFVPTSNNYATAAVATISGTSVSIGSTTTLQSSASYNAFRPNGVTYDETAQKLVVFYMDYSDSEKGKANVCTISGTTISFGTEAEWSNGTVEYIQAAYAPTLNKHVVIWRESTNNYYGMARVATVSGTSISLGTSYNFREVHSLDNAIAWDATGEKFVIATRPNTALALDVLTATVSGTDLSFSDTTRITSTNGVYTNLEYDPDQGKVVGVFQNDGNSGYGTAFVWTTGFFTSNVTATNFAGFSDGAYTNGQTATIQVVGAVDDAQSGLTAGQKYYVQANGNLSTSPDSTSVYGGLAISSTNIIVKG